MKKKSISYFVFTIFLLFSTSLFSQVSQEKRVIKILAIGNSFSSDAVENYMYDLAMEGGDSLVIGNVYFGGCSLQRHLGNATNNLKVYDYRKIVGGEKTIYPKKSLSDCILDENWDYITFQQASGYSGIYSSFSSLTDLLVYVKNLAMNPNVQFALHQTWAYVENSKHPDFSNYNNNQLVMFYAIADTYCQVATDFNISIVIPVGTAIQNGRSSCIGDNFCRDGYHLNLKTGCYIAACTWVEKLTGKSVVNNPFVPKTISDFDSKILQHAAHYAVLQPYSITEMADF
ncbi:MAG: DUF4886 domain-containing protein [Bacteroidales bacterium]|jgi:hypothetical protein|nr:DUF4886 domain-containing protein [Bacteroidales bacterium]